MRLIFLLAALTAGPGALAAEPFRLSLPLACEVGRTCFVQNYVDHDSGPAIRDYACGHASYDGHDGTDIRVRTTADAASGVAVIAPEAGTVLRVRDGVPDRLAKSDADRDAVAGRECGNGVVLDHGDGWETQFCHMQRQSLTVRPGERVERGAKLGLVGSSGHAAFPHVHLTVRHRGKPVDPFLGLAGGGEECRLGQEPLWTEPALQALGYRRGEVLELGFAHGPAELDAIEAGRLREVAPTESAPALVAWGWAINLDKGDRVEIALLGPEGKIAENATVLDRDKAQVTLFSGKKRPAGGWPRGTWTASFRVLRNGAEVLRAERTATVQ